MKAFVTAALAALLLSAGSAQAAESKATQNAPAATVAAVRTQKLDINRASPEELVGVPGIGRRMALAIVDLRSKKGSFSRMEELLEVPGIKEKKLSLLMAHIAVVPLQPSTATPQSK